MPEVLELLLQYKAAVPADAGSWAKNSNTRNAFKKMLKTYAAHEKPPQRGPSSSDRLYGCCHGNSGGVSVHPRRWCPCERDKNIVYGDCCFRRGKYYTETLRSTDFAGSDRADKANSQNKCRAFKWPLFKVHTEI